MKHIFANKLIGIPLAVLLAASVIALVATTAMAISYALNKTIPASVTITSPPPPPPPSPTAATLYSDSLATVALPADATFAFGSYQQGGGPTGLTVYFRATDVTPSTVVVSTTGLPDGAQVEKTVGTPDAGNPGSPTSLQLALPAGLPAGTHSFSVTVTGSGGTP